MALVSRETWAVQGDRIRFRRLVLSSGSQVTSSSSTCLSGENGLLNAAPASGWSYATRRLCFGIRANHADG
jgi:hypothetical protein